MRPNASEQARVETYFVARVQRRGPLQAIRKTAERPLLRLKAIAARERVFRKTFETAAHRNGITVTLMVDDQPVANLCLPPTAPVTENFLTKLLRFSEASVLVNEANQWRIKNPVNPLIAGREYSLSLNPDYEAAEQGVLQLKDSTWIQVSEMPELSAEEAQQVNSYVQLLSEFSAIENSAYATMVELVHWEARSRTQASVLEWEVDAKGHSAANIRMFSQNDEGEVLSRYAEQIKQMYQQVRVIEQGIAELQATVQELQVVRNARHFGDHKDNVEITLKADTREQILALETLLQGIFQFLPQAREIFTERDLSLIDPVEFVDAEGNLVEILAGKVQLLQHFLSWTKESLLECLTGEVLESQIFLSERCQDYASHTPQLSPERQESLQNHWITVENAMRALVDVQQTYPDFKPQEILQAFTRLQQIRLTQRERRFYRDLSYDLARLQQFFPDLATRNKLIFTVISRLMNGVLPDFDDVRAVSEQSVGDLIQELRKFASGNTRLMQLFETTLEFIPLLKGLEGSGYYTFPSGLKQTLEKAVTYTTEATIALSTAHPNAKTSAGQRVEASYHLVRDQLEHCEALVISYLESGAEEN